MKLFGIMIERAGSAAPRADLPRTVALCPLCGSHHLALRRRAEDLPLVVTANHTASGTWLERCGDLLECLGCRTELALVPGQMLVVGAKSPRVNAGTDGHAKTAGTMGGEPPPERLPPRADPDLRLRPRV